MIFGRKKVRKNDMNEDFERSRTRKNDMNEDFEEYNDEYDDFEIYPPMHEIRNEEDRTFTRRGFEKKRVDFGKNRRRGFGSGYRKKKGLPKHEKSTPINRTHGKSPFTYTSGLQLHRGSKSEESEEYPEKKCKSWGVPWK